MDKTAQKHFDAIQSGTITKSNIIGIRKMLNSLDRTASKASFADADNILSEINKVRPVVAGDLHGSGIKLLRNKRYEKRLEPVASVIANLAGFRLIDFQELRRGQFYPIYQAFATDGSNFNFVNIPWQSGGNGPIIVYSVQWHDGVATVTRES